MRLNVSFLTKRGGKTTRARTFPAPSLGLGTAQKAPRLLGGSHSELRRGCPRLWSCGVAKTMPEPVSTSLVWGEKRFPHRPFHGQLGILPREAGSIPGGPRSDLKDCPPDAGRHRSRSAPETRPAHHVVQVFGWGRRTSGLRSMSQMAPAVGPVHASITSHGASSGDNVQDLLSQRLPHMRFAAR